jgi:hypothetical protein
MPAMSNTLPPLPVTPPTKPGVISFQRPPVWPTSIGIVGIIWASFGLLSQGAGLVATLFFDVMKPLAHTSSGLDMAQLEGLTLGMNGGALPFSVWLLVASILLLRRRCAGIHAMRWWAVCAIPLGVVLTGLSAWIQQVQLEAAKAGTSGAGAPAPPQAFFTGIMVFTIVFTLLLALAPPVFVLWWLRRPVIREQIPRWFT